MYKRQALSFQPRNRLAIPDIDRVTDIDRENLAHAEKEAIAVRGQATHGSANELGEFSAETPLPTLPARVSSEDLDSRAFAALKSRNTQRAQNKKEAKAAAKAMERPAAAPMKRPAVAQAGPASKKSAFALHAGAAYAPVVLSAKQMKMAEGKCTWNAARDGSRCRGGFTTSCFRDAEKAGNQAGYDNNVVYQMRKHAYAFGAALWDKKNKK